MDKIYPTPDNNQESNFESEQNARFDKLADSCSRAIEENRQKKAENSRLGNRVVLIAIAQRCNDLSEKLLKASLEKRTLEDLLGIIAQEIIEKSEGRLVCPSFSFSSHVTQSLLVYNGTHWSKVNGQRYIDFCILCAEHCGVDKTLRESANVMKRLCEKIAFNLSREMMVCHPDGQVWINVENGTLVIDDKGECVLRDHNRDDNFFYVLPYCYDPSAKCERWQQFLDQMLPERESQKILAEFLAYCLTKGIKAEKMLVLCGNGSNGKSVILDVVEALMGHENVSYLPLSALTEDDKKRVQMNHKLVNISHESAREIEPSVLKRIVSGEPVDGYVNYEGPVTLTDYGKLITSFNELPTAENTHGFFRRFILLMMKVTVSEKERNVNLAKELIATELPGILNWVLEGMKRFLKNYEFTDSPACNEAIQQYRLQSDNVAMFFSECCELTDGSYTQKGKDVYDAYRKYCQEEGLRALGSNRFYARFERFDPNARFAHQTRMFAVKYKARS